jgi:pSer/pThr/pTyr-binding forkhead associated (FHA) protein
MPKIIISIDGVVNKEVPLTKDRTTLGRRPYNDIVIDNLAVSGEHAVFQMSGADVHIEDLNSTNGTYINGKAVTKQHLRHNDTIEIGKHKIKFFNEAEGAAGMEKTMVIKKLPGSQAAPVPAPTPAVANDVPAAIRVVSGAAAGREVSLTKVVTTIGKPGVAVAAITRRPHGYVVALVEGANKATLNNQPLNQEPHTLNHGDMLELAGTKMQFVQA